MLAVLYSVVQTGSSFPIVLCCACCKRLLRCGVDDLAVIEALPGFVRCQRRDCLVNNQFSILAQIYVDYEPIRCLCCFRSVRCHLAQLARTFNPVSGRRAVIVQDVAEDVGCCGEMLLRSLARGTAITYPSYFFGLDGLDERVVVAEA